MPKDGDVLSAEVKELFPKEIFNVITIILNEGFGLTLVGGSVRDYLLTGHFSDDLDFEIHHENEYPQEEWVEKLKGLGESLKTKHSCGVEFLSFSILRINVGSLTIELSSPRTEKFEGTGPFGHSDFDVELFSKKNYRKSYLRRDFTCNAMGIEFSSGDSIEFKFIDPFNGSIDLSKNEIDFVSDSFPNDPVRFLRLIRFSLKYDLVFSEKMKLEIRKFDLSKLTSFYFLKEGLKSDFFIFAKNFFKLVLENNIVIPEGLMKLQYLKNLDLDECSPNSSEEIISSLIFLSIDIKEEQLKDFTNYVNAKTVHIANYNKMKEVLILAQDIDLESLKEFAKKGELEAFLKEDSLQVIKRFHSLAGKVDSKILINLNTQLSSVFENFNNTFSQELNNTNIKNYSDKIKPSQRIELTLFCHLQVM